MEGRDILIFFIVLFFFLCILGFFVLSIDSTVYDDPLSYIGGFFNIPDLRLSTLFETGQDNTFSGSDAVGSSSGRFFERFSGTAIGRIITVIQIISGVISTVLLALLLMITMRSWRFNDRYSTRPPEFSSTGTIAVRNKVARKDWNALVRRAAKASEESAALLVIEADAILDKTLQFLGIVGDDMAGRMRAITPTLQTSELMWRGHKIRNEIAHTTGYHVSKKQVLGILEDYERVLNELDVI